MNADSLCALKTKKKMEEALKSLIETMPFEKITVSDITDAAGMHRQTFYYHFKDRYELLDWIVNTEILEPLVQDFTFDNMYEKLYDLFSTLYHDKSFYRAAMKINSAELSRYASRVVAEQFTDILRTLGEQSGVPLSEDDTVITDFFGFGVAGVIIRWMQRGMKETPIQMVEKVETLVKTCKWVSVQRSDDEI